MRTKGYAITYDSRLHFGMVNIFTMPDEYPTISEIVRVEAASLGRDSTATGRLILESIKLAKDGRLRRFQTPKGNDDGYEVEDSYGEPLAELPLYKLRAALDADQHAEPYRRGALLLNVIDGLLADPQWRAEGIVCFHYGH